MEQEDIRELKTMIRNLAREGFVQVTFTKLDGTQRVMQCTLLPEYLPPSNDAFEITDDDDGDLDILAVWDIQKNAWRSFKISNVLVVARLTVDPKDAE